MGAFTQRFCHLSIKPVHCWFIVGVFLELSHFYSKFVVRVEHEQGMLFKWVQIVQITIKFHLILKPFLFLSQIAAVFRNKKENIQP